MICIATFYSHFGAIRWMRLCREKDWDTKLMPVPRDLSSSCGTCVRYESDTLCPAAQIPEEVEQIVEVRDGGYFSLFRAENS